ncbi:MAG TPA: hypothetical protein VKV80_20305 [Streptosporangiaceae bacterium]|nr:hypothetical protein [Streptosporangiaceae bacterium]
MSFVSLIPGAAARQRQVLGRCLAAARVFGRRYRRTGRHAMHGRTSPYPRTRVIQARAETRLPDGRPNGYGSPQQLSGQR